ncbi:hypothetical protein GCM10009092_14060 [Bowmanella denitrificans]|uniref:Amidohydrolase-related domain-containing protein n=1 Tax=Bowmanella denitrificans TaxID=366582 RepID=A0ABP3GRK8_9ALTE
MLNRFLGLMGLLPLTLSAQSLLIENATVLSPEKKQPLTSAYVRVENGRVTQVSSAPIQAKPGEIRLDASNQFLIPGLMDSHVHVSQMPGLLPDGEPKTLQQQFEIQQPRSYLYFGVTQLLDPSQSAAQLATFKRQPQHPDIYHCGATPILGGYPTVFTGPEQASKIFSYMIIQADVQQPIPAGLNPAEHTPEAVVAKMAEDGASCVKVFIEDGFGTRSDWPNISAELLARVKQAARQYNLPVMAHANAIDMQKIAVDAELDIMAHGMWNWNQYRAAQDIPDAIRQILDKVLQSGMTYQATFNVMDGLTNIMLPNALADSHYTKVVPGDILTWYHSEPAQWFKQELLRDFEGLPAERIALIQQQTISQGERVIQYLYSKGHPMVLASDTPSSPTYVAQPGLSTFNELKHMHQVGISLKDILAAATINNARAFGLSQDYGSIEAGKVANLLLLNANPLENIQAYDSLDKIILHGEVIDRQSLAAAQ